MPFLTLNHLRLAIVEEGNRGYVDVGRVGRQATGMLTADRRFVSRQWSFKTAPMNLADYAALRGFCERSAVTWPVNGNNSCNLTADRIAQTYQTGATYVSNVGADGAPVIPGPRFGSGALMQGLQGANLWSSNIATGTDALGDTTDFFPIGTASLYSSTARRWQGSRSLKLVAAAAGDGVETAAYGGNPSERWTASFYMTGSGLWIATLRSGTLELGSVTYYATAQWARIVVPRNYAVPTGETPVTMTIVAADPAATCYLDGLMLERTTGDTELSYPWVDGSRQASGWRVDLTDRGVLGSVNGVSINLWSTRIFAPGSQLAKLMYETGQVSLACVTAQGNTIYYESLIPAVWVTDSSGQNFCLPMPTAPAWLTIGAYKMFTVVVDPTPPAGGYSMALYVDGVRVATGTMDLSAFTPEALYRVYFGGGEGERATGSVVDDLTVFPYTLGPVAVKSLYDANAAMPTTWPVLLASGSAIGSATVPVLATVDKAEYLPFVGSDGVLEPHGVSVSITLQEIF